MNTVYEIKLHKCDVNFTLTITECMGIIKALPDDK